MRCLVVDVGGGTSDFSLIRAGRGAGRARRSSARPSAITCCSAATTWTWPWPSSSRRKLPQAGKLDAAQYGMLTQACRQAKEALLGAEAAGERTRSRSSGPRPVGRSAARCTRRSRRPTCGRRSSTASSRACRATPSRSAAARAGLHEMGLPYVSDPAVTRHLAAFLQRQLQAGEAAGRDPVQRRRLPAAGAARAARRGDAAVVRPDDWQPLVLTNPSLDLAVAWGAAYYGWLRHTGGKRIGGGIARSYYVGVEAGDAATRQAHGPVRRAAAAGRGPGDRAAEAGAGAGARPAGAVPAVHLDGARRRQAGRRAAASPPDQLLQLPPLHTVLRGGKRSGAKRVPVTLAARCTEIGTLELFCVAKDGDNRWRLEFNVRDIVKDAAGRRRRGRDRARRRPTSGPRSRCRRPAELIRGDVRRRRRRRRRS